MRRGCVSGLGTAIGLGTSPPQERGRAGGICRVAPKSVSLLRPIPVCHSHPLMMYLPLLALSALIVVLALDAAVLAETCVGNEVCCQADDESRTGCGIPHSKDKKVCNIYPLAGQITLDQCPSGCTQLPDTFCCGPISGG